MIALEQLGKYKENNRLFVVKLQDDQFIRFCINTIDLHILKVNGLGLSFVGDGHLVAIPPKRDDGLLCHFDILCRAVLGIQHQVALCVTDANR